MARLPRVLAEGHCYHLVTATAKREHVFSNPTYAALVVEAVQFIRPERAFVLAYAVMPDHLHMLVAPRGRWMISQIMQTVKGYAARRINELLDRRGALWQQSFFDRVVRDEHELFETVNYIDMNPVVAGLVERPEAYMFSSALRLELTDLDAFFADEPPAAEAGKPRLQVMHERHGAELGLL